uniref:RING-type domain-containing protein n=1 Tax=viral metagenome TaxID=1070528 RepID=A0A6C0KA00_9ZZZZ
MGSECPICRVTIAEGALFTTACNHQFCTPCAERWAEKNTTCPLCRTVVFEPTVTVEIHSLSHSRVPIQPRRNWTWSQEVTGIGFLVGLIAGGVPVIVPKNVFFTNPKTRQDSQPDEHTQRLTIHNDYL